MALVNRCGQVRGYARHALVYAACILVCVVLNISNHGNDYQWLYVW